jgi:hypothetical protein
VAQGFLKPGAKDNAAIGEAMSKWLRQARQYGGP